MTNKNFDKFMKEIKQLFPEDQYECFIKKYSSTNINKEGLIIHEKGSQISPSFNINAIKEELANGINPETVAQNIQESYYSCAKNFQLPQITKEYVLQNSYIAVVNVEKNRELLNNVVYESVEDLAVIVKCRTWDETATFVVNNNICQQLDIEKDELFSAAKENTASTEYTIRTMEDVIYEAMIADGVPKEVAHMFFKDNIFNHIYILQNAYKIDGAGAIVIPEVMQKVFDITNENFYVIPSSRHEVLIFPDSLGMTIEEMQNMVQEVNQEAVGEADFLANSVYHYDMQTKELHMAGTSIEWQMDNRDME